MPKRPLNAVAIAPANAGFFALGLAMLQGIVPLEEIRAAGADYHHRRRGVRGAAVSAYPLPRASRWWCTTAGSKTTSICTNCFRYNLYPGPSAKKGVYGMLLDAGRTGDEPWTTAHCSTVEVVTPYDNTITIMHEGASGGGKSEMLEQMHREADGTLAAGREPRKRRHPQLGARPRLRTAPRNRRHGAVPPGTRVGLQDGRKTDAHRRRVGVVHPGEPHRDIRRRPAPRKHHHPAARAAAVLEHRRDSRARRP